MPIILPANTITGGYEVDNSLRFNSGSSDYLTSSFTTPTNNKIWTLSFWIKRSEDATQITLSCVDSVTSDRSLVSLVDGQLRYQETENGVGNPMNLRTNALLRDFSAWYNIIVAVDTTQATASNRAKIYINGEQVTSFSTEDYMPQNTNTYTNTNGFDVTIGRNEFADSTYLGSYLSEYCFIDGQQLDPTSFGEFDTDSGIWKPIDVSGLTFGNNGFYLDYENSGSLGADVSGNGNNFTVNNLTSIDQTTDTPTNNFATLNALDKDSSITLSNGNLTSATSATNKGFRATLGISQGKWYWEAKWVSGGGTTIIGIADSDYATSSYLGSTSKSWGYYNAGDYYNNATTNSYGNSFANGDIVGIALDADNGYLYFAKNGTWQNSGDPTSGATGTGGISISNPANGFWFPAGSEQLGNSVNYNFGNPVSTISSGNSDANGYGNFEYQPPSGYLALCTKNLATDG